MLTRAEILKEWQVRDGRIVSPGKFEGEPVYAPALYDLMLQGFADESDEGGDLLLVADTLSAEFPEVGDVQAFVVYTDDRGILRPYIT